MIQRYNVYVKDFSRVPPQFKCTCFALMPIEERGKWARGYVPDRYQTVNEYKVVHAIRRGRKQINGLSIRLEDDGPYIVKGVRGC